MAATEQTKWALEGSVQRRPDGTPFLVGGRCIQCAAIVFPVPRFCSECWSDEISNEPLPQEGILYSLTVVHTARRGWTTPYVIGYIDLENGVRVCAPIDCDPKSLPPLDTSVSLTVGLLRQADDGERIMSYRFVPTEWSK